jgi:hypothetical protein
MIEIDRRIIDPCIGPGRHLQEAHALASIDDSDQIAGQKCQARRHVARGNAHAADQFTLLPAQRVDKAVAACHRDEPADGVNGDAPQRIVGLELLDPPGVEHRPVEDANGAVLESLSREQTLWIARQSS